FEDGAPRIDQRPQVADEGADIGEADPPDDPNHGRRDVAIRVVLAAEACNDGDDEDGKTEKLEQEGKAWPLAQSSEAMGIQIKPRITFRAGRIAYGQSDNHKGHNDRDARARDIERKWQRQVVALAEAVRPCRCGERAEACSRNEKQACGGGAKLASADRP